MITKRDKQITKFVEVNGSITINQCAKIFFRDNVYGYDQARKRLQLLYKQDYLKRYRKNYKCEAVYFIDKKLRIHDIKLMDVFAELSRYEIIMFKKEYIIKFDESLSYRVDAYAIIRVNNIYVPIMIEIDYTHFTNPKKIGQLICHYKLINKARLIFIVVKLDQFYFNVIDNRTENEYFVLPWDLSCIETIVPCWLGLATDD